MRREGGGRCAALEPTTKRCIIYARRPPDCRNFDRGSVHCLVVRRAFFDGLRGKKLIKAYVKGIKKATALGSRDSIDGNHALLQK